MSFKEIAWRLLWPLRARGRRTLDVGGRFPALALRDIRGVSYPLSGDDQGRLTLLWFTNFCESCRSRIPLLDRLLEEKSDRIRVLAVSILPPTDPLPRETAPSCRFPILLDPEDVVARRLGLAHPPATCPILNLFILDPHGRVLYRSHLSALRLGEFGEVWRGLLARADGGSR